MMDALKLGAVFIAVILILIRKNNLSVAIIIGGIAAVLLFQIDLSTLLSIVITSLTSKMTINTVLAFYLLTFMQRMMEQRRQVELTQVSLGKLINSHRVVTALVPVIMGLLPTAGAIPLSGAIVDKTADGLSNEDKTFVTSFYRHIPEYIMPTFPAVLISTQITGISLASYFLGVLPMVVVLFVLGYLLFLRKIPKQEKCLCVIDRKKELCNLGKGIWPILLLIAITIVFNNPISIAALMVIMIGVIVNRFKVHELKPMIKTAFEKNLIITTILVMVFKDIILHTGSIAGLPAIFESLHLPAYLAYFFIIFFGTILAGNQAINALVLPIVFSSMPGAGMPIFVLLMTSGYMASQMTPTHICLTVVTDFFHTSMNSLMRKTLRLMAPFFIILLGYYYLLLML